MGLIVACAISCEGVADETATSHNCKTSAAACGGQATIIVDNFSSLKSLKLGEYICASSLQFCHSSGARILTTCGDLNPDAGASVVTLQLVAAQRSATLATMSNWFHMQTFRGSAWGTSNRYGADY